MPKVGLLVGSKSDLPLIKKCEDVLASYTIDYELRVLSAHRTPAETADFAENAKDRGFDLIIAGAGMSAHLAGVIAAHTTIPVIGIPIKSGMLDGLDALLSTVQMPGGIPVATVAVNGAENAAHLAAQVLSLKYPELELKIKETRKQMREKVLSA